MKTDYHMHSTFSVDGHDSPAVMCEQALTLGYTEIAITEHAEWHENGDGFARVKPYLAALNECRNIYEPQGLTILSGVELGNPHEFPQETAVLLAHYPLDITIGSLHHLNGVNIHTPQCFEGKDPYDVFADYFSELSRMSAAADFHIVGHFDRILLQSAKLGIHFDPFKLETIIRMMFSTIIKRGQILELNTSYLAHKPSWVSALITMMRWFNEMGGQRIVVNSDAHCALNLGRNYRLARVILVAAGFQEGEASSPALSPLLPATAV